MQKDKVIDQITLTSLKDKIQKWKEEGYNVDELDQIIESSEETSEKEPPNGPLLATHIKETIQAASPVKKETPYEYTLKDKVIVGIVSVLLAFLTAFLSGTVGGIPIPWYSSIGAQSFFILLLDVILLAIPLYFVIKYIDIKSIQKKKKARF